MVDLIPLSFDNEQIDDAQVHAFEQRNEIPINSSDHNDPLQLRANINQRREIIKSNQCSKTQNYAEFSCGQSEKQYSTQWCLDQHNKSVHEGVKYPCDQCNYKATWSSTLQQHLKSVHEGIKYSCDQCNYTFLYVISENMKKMFIMFSSTSDN